MHAEIESAAGAESASSDSTATKSDAAANEEVPTELPQEAVAEPTADPDERAVDSEKASDNDQEKNA